jgi:hypothetical protein
MDSQQAYLDGRADVGGLLYENYMGKVKPHLKIMDPLLTLFKDVGDGGYQVSGKKLVLAAKVRRSGGAMGSPGHLPNHQYAPPVTIETTPGRFYRRGAIDNFMEALSTGAGSYDNLFSDINEQVWESFEEMQIRHLHGSSTGTVCLVDARGATAAGVGATSITVKDGYGYTGQPALSHIEVGMWVAALDASNAYAVLGAAVISDIDFATNTITFASAIDDGTTNVAAGDPIVFSTTPNTTDSHFQTERGHAKLGLLDHIDPKGSNASYLTLSEDEYPRWKPLRRNIGGVAITEVEFMKFTRELQAKSNSPVTPGTHTMSTQGGIVMALAADISGSAQLNLPKGKTLEGGWETVRVGGHDFLESPYHIFDTIYAHHMEDYKSVDLDGDPRTWTGDGSQFQRIADFDGKEWYVVHYGQDFAERRNRLGALTGIANADANRYVSYPS